MGTWFVKHVIGSFPVPSNIFLSVQLPAHAHNGNCAAKYTHFYTRLHKYDKLIWTWLTVTVNCQTHRPLLFFSTRESHFSYQATNAMTHRLLENLTVAQMSRKILLRNPTFITAFTKFRHRSLSRINPIHFL